MAKEKYEVRDVCPSPGKIRLQHLYSYKVYQFDDSFEGLLMAFYDDIQGDPKRLLTFKCK